MFSFYNLSFNYIDIICVCSIYLTAFTYSFITLFDNSKKKYSPYIYISILSLSMASVLYMHYDNSFKLSFLNTWLVLLALLVPLLFIFISKYDLQSTNRKTDYKYDYDYKRERYNFAIKKNSMIDESAKYFDTTFQKTRQDDDKIFNQQDNNKIETTDNDNNKIKTNITNGSQYFTENNNSIKNNLLNKDNKDIKDKYNHFDNKIMKNLNTIKDSKAENAQQQNVSDTSDTNVKIYEKNFEDKIMQQTKQVVGEMIIKGQEPLVHEIGIIKTDVQTLRDSLQGMIDRMAKLFSLMTTAMKN